jgi:hypothetical protein
MMPLIDNDDFDQLTICDDEWIRWFGYEGLIRNSRINIKNTMSSFDIKYEVKSWPEIQDMPQVTNNTLAMINMSGRILKITKFIVLPIRSLRLLCMYVNTAKSFRIRIYYLALEELVGNFLKYNAFLREQSLQEALNDVSKLEHVIEFTKQQDAKMEKALQAKREQEGFVYFIHEENCLDHFKIGFTYNLDQRLQQLQCGNFRKLKVYKCITTKEPEMLESELHQIYADKRVHGEWFHIQLNDMFF